MNKRMKADFAAKEGKACQSDTRQRWSKDARRAARRFGYRIREVRQIRNISQEELANVCGFHRSYMGAIERGESNLTLATMTRISKGLNLSLSDLFRGIA